MAKNTSDPQVMNRRIRRAVREIAATVLLTLAAFGFLIAAIYGGGMGTQSNAEDVFNPVSAWTDGSAELAPSEQTASNRR